MGLGPIALGLRIVSYIQLISWDIGFEESLNYANYVDAKNRCFVRMANFAYILYFMFERDYEELLN